jgi:hypothetical protein
MESITNGNVDSIRQAPDELFQDFVDRLLKISSRIFLKQEIFLLHNWLMRMLVQLFDHTKHRQI